jgi:hypothetical protein
MIAQPRRSSRLQSNYVLDRVLHGEYSRPARIRDRRGGVSHPIDAPDGPPIEPRRIMEVELDVARCLEVGAWSVARRAIERAREPGRLKATDKQLASLRDGRTVASGDAGFIARRCGCFLLRESVAQAVACLEREQAKPVASVESINSDSHVGRLDLSTRTARRLEGAGVETCGELSAALDRWLGNGASIPLGLGNSQRGEIMTELERHGLLGPVAQAAMTQAKSDRVSGNKSGRKP